MKIAYINPQSRNNLKTYDRYLLENLAKYSNVKIHYYCSPEGEDIREKVARSLPLFKYHTHKSSWLMVFSYVASIIKLFFYIFKQKPDIVHIQWVKFLPVDFLLLLMCKIFLNSRYVFTAHNVYSHWQVGKVSWFYLVFLRIFDTIFVHEKTAAKELKRVGINENIIMIARHGLIPLSSKGTNPFYEKMYDFKSKHELILLFIGEARPAKGLEVLCEALSFIEPKITKSKIGLMIVGLQKNDLKLDSHCKSFKDSVLVINSLVDDICLKTAVSMSDYGVLPYKQISQSGALLTFLADQRPVITSNIGGLGEVASHFPEVATSFNTIEQLELILLNLKKPRLNEQDNIWLKINDFYCWEKSASEHMKIFRRFYDA